MCTAELAGALPPPERSHRNRSHALHRAQRRHPRHGFSCGPTFFQLRSPAAATPSFCSQRRPVRVVRRSPVNDGTQFDYLLAVPVRPGVAARAGKRLSSARLPRITRLLALALRFERLVDEGSIRTYRELAEVGHVSRPRLSQIMQLPQLAPEIQEQVLFLPPTLEGPDRMFERNVRLVARVIDWEKQKELFRPFQEAGRGSA